jgi:hypothetical protein
MPLPPALKRATAKIVGLRSSDETVFLPLADTAACVNRIGLLFGIHKGDDPLTPVA